MRIGDQVVFDQGDHVNLGTIDATRADGQHHVKWANGDVLEDDVAWFYASELKVVR